MNRPHLIVLVFTLILSVAAIGRSETSPPDAAAISAAVEDFHQALAAGKEERAMSLLAPDALIVEAGTVQTRAEYETEHLREDVAFAREVPGTQTSRKIAQVGDAAWVTSTFQVTGTFQGRAVNNFAAETAVLTRTADGWRIRAIHWSSHKATKK
ncbi:MAG: YybH family protein [Chthoniobacterales bacterium]